MVIKVVKMNKKRQILIIYFLFVISSLNAQIGIGTLLPNDSAIIELYSINKGVLVPRMSQIEQGNIISPAFGLIVFNTTSKRIEVNSGTKTNPIWTGSEGPIGAVGLPGPPGPQGTIGTNTLYTVVLDPSSVASGVSSSIGGGLNNIAVGVTATVGGGNTNSAIGGNSFIGGGFKNTANGINASVVGGQNNFATGGDSSVGGGFNNSSSGIGSTISGGNTNATTALSINSTISGGYLNTVANLTAHIAGGTMNTATNINATISGGRNNTASGLNSSVSGGINNSVGSFGEWAGGIYGTTALNSSLTTFVGADRVFNIGNGKGIGQLSSDALTILKNGLATLPSVTNELIANGSDKAVLTKEYADAIYSKISFGAPTSASAQGIKGEIRITATAIYTCIAANTWVKSTIAAGTW